MSQMYQKGSSNYSSERCYWGFTGVQLIRLGSCVPENTNKLPGLAGVRLAGSLRYPEKDKNYWTISVHVVIERCSRGRQDWRAGEAEQLPLSRSSFIL